jgi:tRNA pseudouridine55 synthase
MTLASTFGFLNIDKPRGMTSHDVVDRVRRRWKVKKIGHAGTLDPLATGVLVLCLGPATRLSEYVMDSTKRYVARVRLGVTTTTYDAEGDVIQERDASHVTREDVEHALLPFLGSIEQMPPMYSAIKQGGRKLYDLAREGKTVERAVRPVTIYALDITDWSPPEFSLVVTCSAGTYIRSLGYDIGEALGVGAYLVGLLRVASGRFALDSAVPLDTLLNSDAPEQYVIPTKEAFADWRTLELDEAQRGDILHGRAVGGADADAGTLALVYNADETLLAIIRADEGVWKPQKVFLP